MRNWLTFILLNLFLLNNALAHDGVMPHPETASQLAHFATHALMALPVVAGAWAMVWGVKRFMSKRAAHVPRR